MTLARVHAAITGRAPRRFGSRAASAGWVVLAPHTSAETTHLYPIKNYFLVVLLPWFIAAGCSASALPVRPSLEEPGGCG
jgi:hypothetical protein